MKDNKELRSMSIDELQGELLVLRKTQFSLRLKKASDSLGNAHLFTTVRRSIARVKTIMTEKAGV